MPEVSKEEGNAAQIAYWNERAGAIWTQFQERLDMVFEPITRIILEAAAVAANERVIDIGCGCGATVLALAQRVGPGGSVTGFDVSQPMSARARERIAAACLTNAAVVLADASTHAFPPDQTDLLFSRFGVMFFSDPAAAFANLRRGMRQAGRMACAVWRPLTENPWFLVPLEAARPLVPPQPETEPHAPGPFAFAERDRTAGLLKSAGWRDITFTRHEVAMLLAPPGGIEAAIEFSTRVGPLARILAEGTPDMRLRVRQAVGAALAQYDTEAGVCLSGSIWVITGQA